MTMRLLIFFGLIALQSMGQPVFQLAPPLLRFPSTFFSGSTLLTVHFNQPGAEIRFTLNGNEPTEQDFLYERPIKISKRTLVKAKAFGNSFIASETVGASFIKAGIPVKSIQFSPPNEAYTNNKVNILHDNMGGIADFKNGSWIGYNADTVETVIQFAQRKKIRSVLMNLLQDESSWIFLPEQIAVYYFDHKKQGWTLAGIKTINHPAALPRQCSVQEFEFDRVVKTNQVKLVLLPLKKIPEWHEGKGSHAWLFIDEIKVY